MNDTKSSAFAGRPESASVSPFAPLLFSGCHFFALLRLLWRHWFRVHWKCLPALVLALFLSAVQTALGLFRSWYYDRRTARTSLCGSPMFILGHWRSGTTHLHYLLTQDERHTSPNAYECFAPQHFRLTERCLLKWLGWLRPVRRPMDDVLVGPASPQEDEFALFLLGQPSPYPGRLAFPNDPQDAAAFNLDNLSPGARAEWQRTFLRLLQQITELRPKRIVLKSPLHSLRIKWLLETFPAARFIHIVRDPYMVFPSTVHMRKTSIRAFAWQKATFDGLEEEIFHQGVRLYDQLEAGRRLVPDSQFHLLRYEDLVRNPVGELRRLYAQLGLDGFDEFQPRLEKYLAGTGGYQTNRHELSAERRAEITRRWGTIIERYGYGTNRAEDQGR